MSGSYSRPIGDVVLTINAWCPSKPELSRSLRVPSAEWSEGEPSGQPRAQPPSPRHVPGPHRVGTAV